MNIESNPVLIARKVAVLCLFTAVIAGSAVATELENGVPITGISGQQGDQLRYTLELPSGAEDLSISYDAGTAGAALYVRHGTAPTPIDHHPGSPGDVPAGAGGVFFLPSPSSGTWHVLLYAVNDFSGFDLEGSYVCNQGCDDVGELQNGQPITGLGGQLGDELLFRLEVPNGVSHLEFSLAGGTGDADLFVKRGSQPTVDSFDCASEGSSNDESCLIEAPDPGTWYVMVYAYSDFAGATLVASFAGSCTPDATTLCLPADNRFRVTVFWYTIQGAGGQGDAFAIPLDSLGIDKGGIFYFRDPGNPEFLVKVLNGCPLNGHYWVFYAATTNVGFDLTVTDTVTGDSRIYSNPDIHPATTITDTHAFDICP